LYASAAIPDATPSCSSRAFAAASWFSIADTWAALAPAACLARSTAALDGMTGGLGLACAGTGITAIEPARQIASTPESSALPVFPVLASRRPDMALEGVRIGRFLPPVTNPFPKVRELLVLMDLIRDTSCLQPHWEHFSHK
jgi:hypothetical protein